MRYALTYGAIGGAIAIAAITASIAIDSLSHLSSLWFGYLVMLAALSLIFVGVKRYRDVERGGVIGFGRALGLGLAMGLVAGLVYVAGWEAYLATTDGNFMADYGASIVADLRASGASAAEIAATEAQMAQAVEMYRQPLLRMLITFSEILPVCVLVPVLSALVLRNPRVLPDRRNERSGGEKAHPDGNTA
ncbi:MAG TPA: DUF4199 domain-containing protein [Croceibacterium sp.]|nr:DUF4199 domain-containing protein [Croceibacterium sp.]